MDSTLSVPQEEETLSLLASACLQAPGELTSASQYSHAEKNHSWGGEKNQFIIRLEEVSDANAYLSLSGKMKNTEVGYSRQDLQSYKGTQKIENSMVMESIEHNQY